MTLRLLAFLLVGISPFLLAADDAEQLITLKDQSVIRARVTEMSGGFYSVKSPVLGDMKIPASEVVSIQAEGTDKNSGTLQAAGESNTLHGQPSPAPVGLDSMKAAVFSKVQTWAATREGMDAVTAFSQDPNVKAVMNDPQVMQAIQKGDFNSLMNSPSMKSIMENPRTKTLIQSVLQQKSPAAPASNMSPASQVPTE